MKYWRRAWKVQLILNQNLDWLDLYDRLSLELDPKVGGMTVDGMIWPATGLTVMANSDVDGGGPSDLSAGGRWVSERSPRCGVGATGTVDPTGPTRRATAQDQHAGGGKRHPVSAAHRLPPLALPAARQLSATLDGLQHLSQIPA
jgi:hypothetical protein